LCRSGGIILLVNFFVCLRKQDTLELLLHYFMTNIKSKAVQLHAVEELGGEET
jgi:hypothetical protein